LQFLISILFGADIYGKIRELLSQHLDDKAGRDQVMTTLQEKGVISDLLKQLAQPTSSLAPMTSTNSSAWSQTGAGSGAPGPAPARVIPGRRYMHLKLNGGRAFVESLIDEDIAQSASTLQVCLHFQSQRFRSRPVAFTVEPQFSDSFMIDMQQDGVTVVPFESLLDMKDQLHVLVLKDRKGEVSVVASRFVEWRKVLVHGKLALSVELVGGTADLKTPVGILDFDLEIIPTPNPMSFTAPTLTEGDDKVNGLALPILVPQAVVTKQINRERVVNTETEQRFRTYAKGWWKDYQAIRPEHQSRSITMFAMAEDGSRRFVSSFVKPMSAGRCLDSSLHAARFVRLIPFEKEVKIGGERAGIWSTPTPFCLSARATLRITSCCCARCCWDSAWKRTWPWAPIARARTCG
jgi:centrosomal protein CEP76